MPPTRVVEVLEVVTDRDQCSVPGLVALVVDELGAERGEEALCGGVVPAVTSSAHAGDDASVSKRAGVLVARVGAPAVRVVHEAALGSACAEGLGEGGESEGSIVGRAHR